MTADSRLLTDQQLATIRARASLDAADLLDHIVALTALIDALLPAAEAVLPFLDDSDVWDFPQVADLRRAVIAAQAVTATRH